MARSGDRLNREARAGEIVDVVFLSMVLEMLSGPGAVFSLRVDSRLWTSDSEQEMSQMEECWNGWDVIALWSDSEEGG